ncbi:hypothetical protein [Altericista sp. CCNU0014]|uniref:hypothetical protein n=1 Tax=Altericista sp. CCNU0014 TaxID=3082949 RepID=UPI003850205A
MHDFYKAIDRTAEWIGDLIYQGCETLAKEIEATAIEVEATLDYYLEPIFDWIGEVEEIVADGSRPFVQTVTPVLQDRPVCVGCRNYHGEAYGGNVLVCAIHPYGAEGDSCPDWTSVWKDGSD